jgi:tRNA A58 N-methylase Trm61
MQIDMEQPDMAYALGHSDRELERLISQARLYEPFTMQFFRDAGIAEGMHVLDVGCGAGDVSFLAAQIVGPSGQVVGVDRAEVCGDDGQPPRRRPALAKRALCSGRHRLAGI